MALVLKNNINATLSVAISSTGATSCTVQSGEGALFDDCNGTDWTYATLENTSGTSREIVKVTNRSGDALTIARGQDGSTATTFAIGDKIERRANRGLLQDLLAGMLATINTWAAKQIFTGTIKLQQVLEKETITASAPTTNFDCLTQAIQYFTSNASANWTQNFRGDGSNTLDSIMATGESITVTVKATQGGTAYYPNAHQIDGSSVTPKWLGGTAPTSGDDSSINVYTYTITKTASATFTVLASKSKYA